MRKVILTKEKVDFRTRVLIFDERLVSLISKIRSIKKGIWYALYLMLFEYVYLECYVKKLVVYKSKFCPKSTAKIEPKGSGKLAEWR